MKLEKFGLPGSVAIIGLIYLVALTTAASRPTRTALISLPDRTGQPTAQLANGSQVLAAVMPMQRVSEQRPAAPQPASAHPYLVLSLLQQSHPHNREWAAVRPGATAVDWGGHRVMMF